MAAEDPTKSISDAIDDAPVIADPSTVEPEEPKKKGGGPDVGLPEGCPVQALGMDETDVVVLSAKGQLVRVAARSLKDSGTLTALFAPEDDYLAFAWPKYKRDEDGDWVPTGDPHYSNAARSLIRACAKRDIWAGYDKTRGVGTWIGENDELIYHQGDRIWIGPAPHSPTDSPRFERPGLIDRHVYPSGTTQPRAASISDGGQGAAELFALINQWRWRRGEIDARLMLGWIGCAILGGALDWRPHVWLTGPSGNGKSTLQDRVIRPVLDDALVGDQDTTAAAVRGQLGVSSLPIVLDEKDPGKNDARLQEMIQVIRVAASGGRASRSSAGHEGHQTRLISAALMASSLVPQLQPEDRNRLAILELMEIIPGTPPPVIDKKRMREIGGQLRLQLALSWPQWERKLFWWRSTMESLGHNGRGASVYGTLLAAAEMLLAEDLPESMTAVEPLLEELTAEAIADQRGDVPDKIQCLDHLMAHRIEYDTRRGRRAIESLLYECLGDKDADDKMRALQEHGLTIERRPKGGGAYILIANSHPQITNVIFAGTKWSGGVHAQSLGQLEGAERPGTKRFRHRTYRCIALPADQYLVLRNANGPKPDDDGSA